MEENLKDSEKLMIWFEKLSNGGKIDVFSKLINVCSASLQGEVEDLVHAMRKRDFISNVPKEVAEIIFGYLDIPDLINVQLVSKRWREVLTAGYPLVRRVCQRLDVETSEFETDEQAIAICRSILTRTSSSLEDWFSVRFLVDETCLCPLSSRIECTTINGQDYILLKLSDSSNTAIRLIRADSVIDGYFTDVCRFHPSNKMSASKIISGEAIFCGSYVGSIERWNMRSELVTTYLQHAGAVYGIDGNEQRDLLVTGGTDRSMMFWRMSTGVVLSVVNSFDDWVVELKLKPVNDATSPIFVAVLSRSTAQPDWRRSPMTLSIFSFSTETNQASLVFKIQAGLSDDGFRALSGVFQSIAVSKYGFRFVNTDNGFDLNICDYFADTGLMERRFVESDIELDINRALSIGKKYCLMEILGFPVLPFGQLILLEKRGRKWKIFKRFPSSLIWKDCSICCTDWLDGLRPNNTKGLALASSTDRARFGVAFWK